jgi:hypothetical protein
MTKISKAAVLAVIDAEIETNNKVVFISAPDPKLEPDEITALKKHVEDYRASDYTSVIDNAIEKLAEMLGVT